MGDGQHCQCLWRTLVLLSVPSKISCTIPPYIEITCFVMQAFLINVWYVTASRKLLITFGESEVELHGICVPSLQQGSIFQDMTSKNFRWPK